MGSAILCSSSVLLYLYNSVLLPPSPLPIKHSATVFKNLCWGGLKHFFLKVEVSAFSPPNEKCVLDSICLDYIFK